MSSNSDEIIAFYDSVRRKQPITREEAQAIDTIIMTWDEWREHWAEEGVADDRLQNLGAAQ